jgi:hypothetical protein
VLRLLDVDLKEHNEPADAAAPDARDVDAKEPSV